MQQVEKAAAVLGEKMKKKILQKQTAPRIKNQKTKNKHVNLWIQQIAPKKGYFPPMKTQYKEPPNQQQQHCSNQLLSNPTHQTQP